MEALVRQGLIIQVDDSRSEYEDKREFSKYKDKREFSEYEDKREFSKYKLVLFLSKLNR